MVDERTAEEFRFHLTDPSSGWYWQRAVLNDLIMFVRLILLKARQLGLTWLCAGYGNLWVPLYKPGSLTLIYRQTETEAQEILDRVWEMWLSLPPHLRNGAKVLKPARGSRPSNMIQWEFADGRVSETRAMASTSAAGHGRTVAFALLDEFSRIEKASEIMKAVQPAAGSQGGVAIVSTANGVADPETGEGNYYAYLWETAEASGFHRSFLPWSLHPDRDQDWYDNSPEVRGLRAHERAEQYPSNPNEAFTLSNQVFFDEDALAYYAQDAYGTPLHRFDFEKRDKNRAAPVKRANGYITVFREPKPDGSYAIGADPAEGRGRDYSAAYVIDLQTMELCAEFHARLDADLFAFQLHYLGRLYNTAWICVETSGGHGDAVIIPLRDGREGRPHYPKLYIDTLAVRIDMPHARKYGLTVTSKNRPQLTQNAEKLVRERALPYLTRDLLAEMWHFIRRQTGTTPAAQDGTRDDRVMAFVLTLELYRQYGHHPDRNVPKPGGEYKPLYPWEPASKELNRASDSRSKHALADGTVVDRYGRPVPRRRARGRNGPAFRKPLV